MTSPNACCCTRRVEQVGASRGHRHHAIGRVNAEGGIDDRVGRGRAFVYREDVLPVRRIDEATREAAEVAAMCGIRAGVEAVARWHGSVLPCRRLSRLAVLPRVVRKQRQCGRHAHVSRELEPRSVMRSKFRYENLDGSPCPWAINSSSTAGGKGQPGGGALLV